MWKPENNSTVSFPLHYIKFLNNKQLHTLSRYLLCLRLQYPRPLGGSLVARPLQRFALNVGGASYIICHHQVHLIET
jgi:hypothetical protein